MNVPGSPSSALQMTKRSSAAGRAGELPLHSGRKSRPAPAAQTRRLDLADDLGRTHRQGVDQPGRRLRFAEDHVAAQPDVVVDGSPHQVVRVVAVAVVANQDPMQVVETLRLFEDPHSTDRGPGPEPRHDEIVDQRRRRLIRHADAGDALEREPAVRRRLPKPDPELPLQALGDLPSALELVDHVVAETNGDLPLRSLREKGVEGDDPLDLDARNRQMRRDLVDGRFVDTAQSRLDVAENVQETRALPTARLAGRGDRFVRHRQHGAHLVRFVV